MPCLQAFRAHSSKQDLIWPHGALPAGRRPLVTDTAVREGDHEAVAVSLTEIRSSYQGARQEGIKREVVFKFSLNGLDNERPPFQDLPHREP